MNNDTTIREWVTREVKEVFDPEEIDQAIVENGFTEIHELRNYLRNSFDDLLTYTGVTDLPQLFRMLVDGMVEEIDWLDMASDFEDRLKALNVQKCYFCDEPKEDMRPDDDGDMVCDVCWEVQYGDDDDL